VELVQRLDDSDVRDWYALQAPAWSRAQLREAIATRLHEREGAAITNFTHTLQTPDAEAVQRIARDPVVLDFVRLGQGARERDLETALLEDIERFMLALGEGFYFAERQKPLRVGGEEFILDLLFYHHPTRRFVVIDLKIGSFQAEFAGKMNLYVNAVDAFLAHEEDRETVGFGSGAGVGGGEGCTQRVIGGLSGSCCSQATYRRACRMRDCKQRSIASRAAMQDGNEDRGLAREWASPGHRPLLCTERRSW